MASMKVFSVSCNSIQFYVKAKYYKMPNGKKRLAMIQKFSVPKFTPKGWEMRTEGQKKVAFEKVEKSTEQMFADAEANKRRAKRRAQKNAFDIIMCNQDLDLFCTFTYSPEAVKDKSDYAECYKHLNVWLTNRVQRRGLKYVCVAEYTKNGDIHFHALMNSSALEKSLVAAVSPKTGRALTHNGKQLYNLHDWTFGFSSCEFVGQGYEERDKVAKYIFKYMSKQSCEKIGGRYALIGGKVERPIFEYGDSESEFADVSTSVYSYNVNIEDVTYTEWSFI